MLRPTKSTRSVYPDLRLARDGDRKAADDERCNGDMGQIVMNTHEYADDPKPWVESMHRIAKEVVPHVKDVVAAAWSPPRGGGRSVL